MTRSIVEFAEKSGIKVDLGYQEIMIKNYTKRGILLKSFS